MLRDSFEDKNLINSNALLVGDVATIITKYENFTSTIVQYSKTTPKLFGLKENEFDKITSINLLMPSFLSDYHDQFVGRIVKEGNPHILRKYKFAIAQNSKGYGMPVKIFIDYFFDIHE